MAGSKQCFKCAAVKPISEFYKHAGMADGHLNKCKDCARRESAENRLKNLDRVRAYDRARGKTAERIALSVRVKKEWLAQDKRRSAAHNAVARAIRSGRLVKEPCERCASDKSMAHHDDYDFRLSVRWLCAPCHKERHKELNAIQDRNERAGI